MREDWPLEVARQLGELNARVTESMHGYQQLREDLKGGLDKITTAIETHTVRDNALFDKIDRRIRSLERFRAWIIGVFVACASGAATVVKVFAVWR